MTQHQVIVGNIGTIYEGPSFIEAGKATRHTPGKWYVVTTDHYQTIRSDTHEGAHYEVFGRLCNKST